ncbi:hypothetical protein [Thalassotalea litorea]
MQATGTEALRIGKELKSFEKKQAELSTIEEQLNTTPKCVSPWTYTTA